MSIREQLLFALVGVTILAASLALSDPILLAAARQASASARYCAQGPIAIEVVEE